MYSLPTRVYSVSAEVAAPWRRAFDFLQEPLNLGKWALGCRDSRPADEEGLYAGTSLFSGESAFYRLSANEERRLVDFLVGSPDDLRARISARVIAGPVYGNSDAFCIVTMDAWRDLAMDDARWHQLCACHETEILLLKSLIEAGY